MNSAWVDEKVFSREKILVEGDVFRKSFTLSGLTVLRLVKKGGKAPEAISVRGGNRLPARFDLSGFSVSQARGNDYPARLPPEFC